MASRFSDWYRQAVADLRHARNAVEDGDYEWSCFAAHQAAEMALKSVFLKQGMDVWGHTLIVMIGSLPGTVEPPSETLANAARILDKFYIPTRYPSGFDSGAPTDYYTQPEARHAIQLAEAILEYCRHQID